MVQLDPEQINCKISDLQEHNEKMQKEINHLYFLTIVLGLSSIIAALGTVLH